MKEAVLYDFWRSSASYRVRIALNLAGVPFKSVTIDLVAGGQQSAEHVARNPQGLVPVLDLDGLRLTQSLAIIEYLEETRSVGFLPESAPERARLRALAYSIAMEIHPICNTSVAADVVRISGKEGEAGEEVRIGWMQRHIRKGLVAFERLLDHPGTGRFCHGDRPGLADCCLVPQLYNALRWGAKIEDLSRLQEIAQRCEELDAFSRAHPDNFKPA
ncbi:maleylacetoacetate isomerase [Salaquimonas pukyongi]|uniref:maleylacetoacetate isomerase n=1 Tax=Salaquimonas pukyongi TaxID=2712698 RepID=UPI0012ECB791|nr:maleylacetoacetate isomerase [Salaquimonas pukyongi]